MPETPITPGLQVGPYRIDSPLGRGGMGQVFRAHDTKLNRPAAIKFLSDSLADADARRRFQREAQAVSSLNHPHILTVYDVGDHDGRQYLATEFVDGGTLADWAHAQKRTCRQIVDLMIGVADGLAAAHAAGILHRDVKPQNILVARNGYAKLADFGLAKLDGGAQPGGEHDATVAAGTRRGIVLGTAAYMSPEQAAGQTLDARSDIFSLGIVLYELLAGQRPFSGTSDVQLLGAIMRDAPKPLPADTPIALRLVVEKALEKDPDDRYQAIREMVVDLKRTSRAGDSGAAAAPSAPRRGSPWPWIIAAGSVVAAIMVIVWTLRNSGPADPNPLADATFTRVSDFEGIETDAAISRDGRFVAFRSDRDGPVDTWVTQVGSGTFLNLTHGSQIDVLVRNTGFSPDGSEVWLSGVIGGTRLRLLPSTGGMPRPFLTDHAMSPSWSPEGNSVVFHTYDDGDPMFVADSKGGNAKQIFVLDPGGHSHFPTWSTDGQWIYFVSGMWGLQMDLWRIRPAGGTPEQLTHHNSDVRHVAPIDDHTVIYVSPDENGGGPWLWALDTNRRTSRRISAGLETFSSVEASADGRRLVVTRTNPTANLWTLPLDRRAEAADVKPLSLPTVRSYAPRYGRDALYYLSSRGSGDGLWKYVDGQATEVWRGKDGALFEPPSVSADGRRLAIILRKAGKRTLHTLSPDGADVAPLAPALDVSSSASFSPDNAWIVASADDGTGPGLFKIPTRGGDPVRLTKGVASSPEWSPDGSLIVYAGPAVGVTGALLAIRADGTPVDLPPISMLVRRVRYRFVPGQQKLVYVPGTQIGGTGPFWELDLKTMATRQLSNVGENAMRTFDVTPDGKQIVFDRIRENSNIVLIDLPPKR